jgi:hypothetical protein
MEYILSSLDMFAGISDNLINYTFNVSRTPYDFRYPLKSLVRP